MGNPSYLASMYIVYGIPNCNTVKSAINWLKVHQKSYTFYDYKKQGITAEKLQEWIKQKGWETLINKKGTTWRSLDILQQKKIVNEKLAINYLMENNSSIRRPIIELDKKIVMIGFDESIYTLLFSI